MTDAYAECAREVVLRVFVPGLIGVVLIIALRAFFISPMMSLSTIGDANRAIGTAFEEQEAGELTAHAVADTVQTSLYQSHNRWIRTLILFDGIFVVAVVATIYSGLRRLSQPQVGTSPPSDTRTTPR